MKFLSLITKYRIIDYFRDHLIKNSIFILMGTFTNALIGAIFLFIAARFYSTEDIGLANAIISAIILIILISRFGLDHSMMRFFPDRNRQSLFNTSFILSTIFGIIISIIYILLIDFISPDLSFLQKPFYFVIFLFIITAHSFFILASVAFNASRKGWYYLFQNLLLITKIPLLFILISYDSMGIVIAFGLSVFFTIIISWRMLEKIGIKLQFKLNRDFLRDSFHFSAGNYAVSLFTTIPILVMPLIVLNILGSEQTAYYSIAYAVASILFMIPISISTSLFVEGSHQLSLDKLVKKSISASIAFLTPIVIIVYFSSEWILRLIGNEYATGGYELLRIFSLSSFFVGFYMIFLSIKRIQKEIKTLIQFGFLVFVLLIVLSYVFIILMDIQGVGYAWLSSYGICCLVIVFYTKFKQR